MVVVESINGEVLIYLQIKKSKVYVYVYGKVKSISMVKSI